ncbi:MAG TPA: hypothetical protein VKX49_26225 [Bryobacteraceae bacterium]|nr:hypothetical protein [Bryobacteraceae bacterium]
MNRFLLLLCGAALASAQPTRNYNPFNQLCLPNTVVAGPSSGTVAKYPVCRALVSTDFSASGLVTAVNGTTQQITSSTASGVVTLSLSNNLLLPSGTAFAGSYADPSFITSLSWSKIIAAPIFLQAANNLSDLASASIARANLGLGSFATLNNPLTTLGDLLYGGAAGAPARLAGSTSTVRTFLISQGTGTAAAAPFLGALQIGDIPPGYAWGNLSGVPSLPTIFGTPTAGNCVTWHTSTTLGDAGAACGSGSGGITQLTGDATAGPGTGSQALTLASVNAGPGVCGDSTHVCQVTTNGKGLVTSQSQIAVTGGTVSAATVGAALVVSDTGSANAYAGCPTPSVTLADGVSINLRPANTNTGSSTFALCGGSALPIANANGTALAAGQIIAASSVNPSQALLIYHSASGKYELANQPYPILPPQSLFSRFAAPVTNGTGYSYMRAMVNPADGRRNAFAVADGSAGLQVLGMNQFATNTSAGATTPIAAAGSNPAMTQTTSGATSGNQAYHYEAVSGSFNTNIFRLGRNVVFDWVGAIGAVTSVRFWAGIHNCGSTIMVVDTLQAGTCAGEAFRFSTNVSDTTIHCQMSNGSVADTSADTGIAPDTNPHRFTIINDDTASALHWYIDSVEVCSGFSTVNLVTGNVGAWISVTTLAAQNNSISTASLFLGADK